MPLLTPRDAAAPFDQTAEPTLAVRRGLVSVAAIEMAVGDDGFTGYNDSPADKHVAVATYSGDDGSFDALVDPQAEWGGHTSDPVIRASASGLWLGLVRAVVQPDGSVGSGEGTGCRLLRSQDGSSSWQELEAPVLRGAGWEATCSDKEWIAADDVRGGALMAGAGGGFRYDALGRMVEGTLDLSMRMTGAFVDEQGAFFVDGTGQAHSWSGRVEAFDRCSANRHGETASIGRLADGRLWVVRAVDPDGGHPRVVLEIIEPGACEVVPVTEPDLVAFYPAAVRDGSDRLAIAYYDTTGERGELHVVRSRTAEPTEGFGPATVVDPDACPGNGWDPEIDRDRRLREYIDITAEGDRLWVAWTHAPSPPARVWVAGIAP